MLFLPHNNRKMARAKSSERTPSPTLKFDKKTYLFWYESMLTMRKTEEKAAQYYIQQKIRGFLHLYNGQEAIVAGSVTATRPSDNMITAYRDHAHPIGRGMHPKYIMAELFGKVTGCSRGKGGSMHMFDVSRNFYGGHGIVGGQIPLGTGLAFAEKYKGTDNVTLCYMGDGAVRQGALHESFNLAMTWKLPVVYIIENNLYAMGTSVGRSSNVTDLYLIGAAYQMPSYPVDGMSCEAVHEAVAEAVAHARAGKGPTLLEMKTYRYKGHSMSDPRKYRTKEEEEKYMQEDPILKVMHTIRIKGIATDRELEEIEARVDAIIEEACAFAEQSPFPEPHEIYTDVYKQPDYPFVKE